MMGNVLSNHVLGKWQWGGTQGKVVKRTEGPSCTQVHGSIRRRRVEVRWQATDFMRCVHISFGCAEAERLAQKLLAWRTIGMKDLQQ